MNCEDTYYWYSLGVVRSGARIRVLGEREDGGLREQVSVRYAK